jgi:hypothetical protein
MRAARLLAAFGLAIVACAGAAAPDPSPSASVTPRPSGPLARQFSAADAEAAVGVRVRDTLAAFKKRDGAALAALAHPSKGIRFTPYSYLQASNITLSVAQLGTAFTDPTKRTWGFTDGRGDPITLTFADYVSSYVYERAFAASSQTAYNKTIGFGNSIDNTATVYPDAILFEAYDPGPDPALKDFQWRSLRLLFERTDNRWYLVSVIHAAWTI